MFHTIHTLRYELPPMVYTLPLYLLHPRSSPGSPHLSLYLRCRHMSLSIKIAESQVKLKEDHLAQNVSWDSSSRIISLGNQASPQGPIMSHVGVLRWSQASVFWKKCASYLHFWAPNRPMWILTMNVKSVLSCPKSIPLCLMLAFELSSQ